MSEIRQRKPTKSNENKNQNDSNNKGDKKSALESRIVNIFNTLEPYAYKLFDLYLKARPYIEIVESKILLAYNVAKPYYVPEMTEIFIGFVLLFFGGTYAMTVACYTAIQISGLDVVKSSWRSIVKNYRNAKTTFYTDDSVKEYLDSDGDGEITATEILKGASKVFKGDSKQKYEAFQAFKNVLVAIDPNEVMKGVSGIWTTILALVATLRSRFAKDVALGANLGQMLSKSLSRYIDPLIEKNVEERLRSWAHFAVDFIFKSIGITLAFLLVRMTSAVHSSVKGSKIITFYIFNALGKYGALPDSFKKELDDMKKQMENINKEETSELDKDGDGIDVEDVKRVFMEGNKLFMFIQYVLAFYGFWWQLRNGFNINSIFLRLLLWPFSFLEGILTFFTAY